MKLGITSRSTLLFSEGLIFTSVCPMNHKTVSSAFWGTPILLSKVAEAAGNQQPRGETFSIFDQCSKDIPVEAVGIALVPL